jgi:all-trans-retinol 13,14-reductase
MWLPALCGVAAAAVGIAAATYRCCTRTSVRDRARAYRSFFSGPGATEDDGEVRKWTRRRFTVKRAAQRNWDVVVVGSGPAGLATAALLTRTGRRVLVLERNETAGGGLHTFTDHGFEHESGLHYVGTSVRDSDVLRFATDRPLQWAHMAGTMAAPYDRLSVGGASHGEPTHWEIPGGERRWIDSAQILACRCGQDPRLVVRYLNAVRADAGSPVVRAYYGLQLLRAPRWLVRRLRALLRSLGGLDKIMDVSAADRMREIGIDPASRLGAFLLGQFGDAGASPGAISWFAHAAVVKHYLGGALYPVGGPGEIVRRMAAVVRRGGGDVLCQADVTGILVSPETLSVCGVRVRSASGAGEVFTVPCACVVSAAGAPQTWALVDWDPERLADPDPPTSFHQALMGAWDSLPDKRPGTDMRAQIKALHPSTSCVAVFVGIRWPQRLPERGDLCREELPRSNTWLHPGPDHDATARTAAFDDRAPLPLFVAFSSVKDPSWPERHPGVDTAVVIALAPASWTAEWAHLDERERRLDRGYVRWKARMTERLLPLTVRQYIGGGLARGHCGMYGLAATPERFALRDATSTMSPVDGLYLAGQDTLTSGLAGGLASAELAANAVCGYGTLRDVVTGANLLGDLRAVYDPL